MKHKDIEFHIDQKGEEPLVLKDHMDAFAIAMAQSISRGEAVILDVVVWSIPGARAWGGDSAVASYQEDPDASVLERLEIKCTSHGRIA